VAEPAVDALARPLRSLRLSVTDRCNLRCAYCLPNGHDAWIPGDAVLRADEIALLVNAFVDLGVEKVRLTGGEPLLRRDLADIVRNLSAQPGIRDLSLTTNGVRLRAQVQALREAGLQRVNVSLDTLRPERFARLTRRTEHAAVLAGIEEAVRNYAVVKVNVVVLRGINDDELVELLEYGRSSGVEVRFIEYMDVGTVWAARHLVSRAEMLDVLGCHFGAVSRVRTANAAPAERFTLADGTTFGIIASMTAPFCAACDRSRLSADGTWYDCLYAPAGLALGRWLRRGVSLESIRDCVGAAWQTRVARGAEFRRERRQCGVLPLRLQRDGACVPMHARGG